MTCNNPNIDLVNMNTYIKFGELMTINLTQSKGLNSGTNVQKMLWNNPNVDLVNMNAYIKFGEILSIRYQEIDRKQNFGVNQGP